MMPRPATVPGANPRGSVTVLPFDEVTCEAERLGFWERFTPEPNTGCLLWTGGTGDTGYGVVYLRLGGAKAIVKIHRVAWVLAHGEIDPALTVDHACFNPSCGNVAHMELVSFTENLARRRAVVASRARTLSPRSTTRGTP